MQMPTDFRSTRTLLPDHVFALANGPRPAPSDLITESDWHGIMHLPDDVALTTSGHHGRQLATLYLLRGDWIKAIGDDHDELFDGMLDAADCFQTSTFDALHGYYRSAISNLRSALELVAIGVLGNLQPADEHYERWRKRSIGSLSFAATLKKLRRVTKHLQPALIFEPKGWLESLYDELCAYTHSRPDSSDGQMWSSNGPIYVGAAFSLAFELQTATYAACYVLARVGRTQFELPTDSEFLLNEAGSSGRRNITASYRSLCAIRAESP